MPPYSNEYAIQLSDTYTSSNKHNIDSDTSSSCEKSNSVMKNFKKIVKRFDCLNVEKRGIERILPEDRTDSTTINTAMIWVRNRLINLR